MPDRLQGDIQNISQGLKLIKLIASDLYVNVSVFAISIHILEFPFLLFKMLNFLK